MISTKELLEAGVAPARVSMRKWRRERGLTVHSMALMLGCRPDVLSRFEIGAQRNGYAIFANDGPLMRRYQTFVERWEKVPEARAALAEQVHRDRMRRSAAARARKLAVLAKERSCQTPTP